MFFSSVGICVSVGCGRGLEDDSGVKAVFRSSDWACEGDFGACSADIGEVFGDTRARGGGTRETIVGDFARGATGESGCDSSRHDDEVLRGDGIGGGRSGMETSAESERKRAAGGETKEGETGVVLVGLPVGLLVGKREEFDRMSWNDPVCMDWHFGEYGIGIGDDVRGSVDGRAVDEDKGGGAGEQSGDLLGFSSPGDADDALLFFAGGINGDCGRWKGSATTFVGKLKVRGIDSG